MHIILDTTHYDLRCFDSLYLTRSSRHHDTGLGFFLYKLTKRSILYLSKRYKRGRATFCSNVTPIVLC